MTTNIPTELLRSFAAIVDAGSMAKASERVFLTQSALSLQIKRLEELVQCSLFLREGTRRLVLSPIGHEMLSYARQILDLNDQAVTMLRSDNVHGKVRVGMSQDFAEVLLTGVLRQFSRVHTQAQLEVCTADTETLLRNFRDGEFDVVLAIAPLGNVNIARRVDTLWIGNADLVDEPVLPLALLNKPCAIRDMVLRTLDAAGKPYRIVVQTPHLTDLQAAVAAGLGITCRTGLFLNNSDLTAIKSSRLPKLQQTSFLLDTQNPEVTAVARLNKMIRQTIDNLPC